MKISAFGERIGDILSASPTIVGAFSRIDLIMNPAAGTFKKKESYLSRLNEVGSCLADFIRAGSGKMLSSFTMHITRYPGHAADIIRSFAGSVQGQNIGGEGKHLIITAGGDGTHLEALTALIQASEHTRERTCVFRLPMGTGNDSADACDISEACSVLSGNFAFSRTGAVRFRPKGMEPLYAFNIGSLGLDAFVVDLSNRLKSHMPGGVYKAMVNVATVFYEPLYGVKEMTVSLRDGAGATHQVNDRFIMLVVGLSGRRTYGDHMKILPGDENVCMVSTAGLFRKLAIKKLFYTGDHGGLPEVTLAGAEHLIVEYDGSIPLQTDGEAVWLSKDNFPLEIDLMEPAITVLHGRN